MLEPLLERLGNALRDEESRKQLTERGRRIFRWGLWALTISYALFLLLMPVLAAWIGERNMTLAFLLYVPRVVPLLPLALLMVFTLFFSRIQTLIQFVAGLAFLTFGMGFEWRPNKEKHFNEQAEPHQLTILSYNRGQHAQQSLQPFKMLAQPDLLVMQEAPGRSHRYLADPNYSEFKHGKDIGEHLLLSRYPILSGELIDLGSDIEDSTPAARFIIDFKGREVAVYSVHFITVRDTLRYYSRGAFLHGIIGLVPGTPFHQKMKANQKMWHERIRTAQALKKKIHRESLPTLVVGDFNAPSGGYIHRLMKRGFHDCHQAAGSGFGYTFPGVTRNPLSLRGPWMRIDYILAGQDWEVEACLTESDRPSQHRALAATLSLKSKATSKEPN